MNLIKNSLVVILLTLFFTSCNKDDEQILRQSQSDSETFAKQGKIIPKRNYSSNSLVVKYSAWVKNDDKPAIRALYNISSFQICENCINGSIELWIFEDNIEIEPKRESINNIPPPSNFPTDPNRRPAIEFAEFNYDTEVETNSTYNTISTNNKFTPPPSISYLPFLKLTNSEITIAVMDTGINPSLGMSAYFLPRFLYKSSGTPGVYSGWDFVNNDHDCADDDPNQHGTAVTSVITRQLNNYGITNYQIMPLKVCNASGKGSYFNLLCGLSFALERKVDIIQMSLGWYNTYGNITNNIFTNLINQNLSNTPNLRIICSAGNDGENMFINPNNDYNSHCPSGFPINQIIAVASCKSDLSNISTFSNYGLESVDFYAKGENIPFLGNQLEGTSFAAPVIAARVAKYKREYGSNMGIENHLINTGLNASGFDISRPIKYKKIILP